MIIATALVAFMFLALPFGNAAGEVMPEPDESIKNITFYLKHTDIAENIADFTTTRFFDTEMVESGPGGGTDANTAIQTDWFLAPELASSARLEGTMHFYIWMKRTSITGDSRNAEFEFTLYDVDQGGNQGDTIMTATTGNIDTDTDWQEYHVTGDLASTYTVPAGHSIECEFILTGSASNNYEIAYGNTSYKSRLVLGSRDYVRVHDVLFYDYQMDEKTLFPVAVEVPNHAIHIRADITDPFGGYDIVMANLTLTSPTGTVLLTDVSMTKISGDFKSYHSVYEYIWDYSSAEGGQYNATITTVDQTGWNYRYPSNPSDDTYGGHLDRRWSNFWIGGEPVDLWVQAIDDGDMPLSGARVEAFRADNVISNGQTNSAGLVELEVSPGSYSIIVTWQDIRVGNSSALVIEDNNSSYPIVVQCSVYSPVLHAVDSNGLALSGSTIIITHPNGIRLAPMLTDEGGNISLAQTPAGDYEILIVWRGTFVYDDTVQISSSEIIVFDCDVYHLGINVQCSGGNPMADVHVIVQAGDNLYGSGYTDINGLVTIRVPAGNYTVTSRYRGQYMLTGIDQETSGTVILDKNSEITLTFDNYPPSFFGTNMFFVVLAILALILLLVFVVYKGMKNAKSGAEPAVETKLEEENLEFVPAQMPEPVFDDIPKQ